MSNRIYVVSDSSQDPVKHRLIRAGNNAQARNFAARNQFTVDVAGQQTLVDLLASGVEVEDASAEPQS